MRPCPVCGGRDSRPDLVAPAERLDDGGPLPGVLFRFRRCAGCEACFLDALPAPETLRLYYESPDYHFRVSPGEGRGLLRRVVTALRRAHLALARPLPPGPPGALLDFGCGPGDYLDLARSRGWRAVGVEFSADSAAAARARGFEVVLQPDLPSLPDGAFRAASMLHSLEHHPAPAQVLALLASKLAPDGSLLVEVPSLECWEARWAGPHYSMLQAPVHLQLFTDRTMDRLARAAGLRLAEIRTNVWSPVHWVWSALNRLEARGLVRVSRTAKNRVNALLFPLTLPFAALEAGLTGRGMMRQYRFVRG